MAVAALGTAAMFVGLSLSGATPSVAAAFSTALAGRKGGIEMHADIVFGISVCILGATVFAFVAKWLRQPLILAYLLSGVLIGYLQRLGWVSRLEEIETVSEIGLILLLFMIGLEIDLKKLSQAGKPVVAAGIGQFLICFALGVGFVWSMGLAGGFGSLYLSLAMALSSTMIVVKLLYEKFELDTTAGRITLGILVFQDVWAILFLALQPNLRDPSPVVLLVSLAKGIALVSVAFLTSRYGLPVLFRSVAKLPELMLIGALGWCFGLALLAEQLGLSRAMGALIAGISISTFPYNLDVIGKIVSLRDFFITLFFVTLGAKVPSPSGQVLAAALACSAFLVVSRFVAITPVLRLLRLGNRASLVPAINLAQVSEFSIVIAALGVAYGHISQQLLGIIVFMLAVTSVGSTYGILYNHEIAVALNRVLRRLGIRDLDSGTTEAKRPDAPKPIVFLGFARHASSLLHELLSSNAGIAADVCVVDFNPDVKHELDRRGIQAIYGDISSSSTLHHAKIHGARVLIGTVPDSILKGTTNARLLRNLRRLAPHAQIIVTAETFSQARQLYEEGAHFVFLPRMMGVRELQDAVLTALRGELEQLRASLKHKVAARGEVLP